MREQHIIDTFRQRFGEDIGFISAEKQLMTYLVTVRFSGEQVPRAFTGFIRVDGVNFVNSIFLPFDPKLDVFVPLEPGEFRIVCAWCNAVKNEGTAGAPTSHTICKSCSRKLEVA